MRLRLGTRGSRLALEQARRVAEKIRAKSPGIGVELVVIQTSGDERSEFGDEIANVVGEFSSELEKRLLKGEIQMAVHSAKDLPTYIPESLVVGAYPERADPRDAWVFRKRDNSATRSDGWVGTESPRRRLFWGERKPESRFRTIRGNVDRRMERCLLEKDWQGVLLACAGIDRLGGVPEGLEMERLDVNWMIPAPGQGAIAVQCRKDDLEILKVLAQIDDPAVRRCVSAEKSFLHAWGGGCSESLGAFAQIQPNGTLHLCAGVKNRFDEPQKASSEGPALEAELIGARLVEEMRRE
jgi:hydroxymethylbilane synthase